MSTSINRKKAVIAVVLALALGAILLTLTASAAHAGPGDGPGSDDPANVPPGPTALALPPKLQASENPVVFKGDQTKRWIWVTGPQYNGTVRVIWTEDGVQTGPGAIIVSSTTELTAEINYGKTYKTHLETIPENGQPKLVGPTLTITTVRVDVTTASPQPTQITPTLIPIRPILPPAGTR